MLPWLCWGLLWITLAPFYLSSREWLLIIGLVVLLFFSLFLILQLLAFSKTRALQKMGLFPSSETATLKDVKNLVKAGERIHAIKLYRSLQHVSLPDAVQAIDKMQVVS